MNILIVEDEPGISSFLKKGLEEEGYTIDLAATGSDGLKLAQRNQYGLLLLDWMLPGMSGLEVCVQFREKDKSTPIIFITAKDTIQETIAGLKAGANDYIKKPFHFEELLERIKVQFRNAPESETEYLLGDILMNTNTHQVFRAGQEIVLTQKEFSLLEYLIRNKGKICTRNQIIEEVWNIHFEYDTGVIDVFMNSLRKKLNLKKEEDYIRTIRGIGYIANELT
ncbi:response regulator transcription factor [Flavobacterium sp.]|uniref:response regulator transcription factor n=1 Tax=Flavobacterium sp. TaxID=239 RepID=UPI002632F199|nr:response regulator transcription factor [Flavobacterium sp.]